ncbi:MAG: FtsX-like permease family protein, partial [Chloroflexota bacterium]
VNVPMLGYVEERWTTLGAAVEVTHGINSANLILLACLLAATGLYVTNLSQLALVARRWEIGLLKAVGWRKREMITSLVVGAASLGLLAGVLGALGSVALSLALGLQPALGVIGAVTLGAPVLYSCAAAFPILAATQRAPAALLGQGEVEPFRHIRGRSAQLHATALALRQIWRRRLRTLLAGTIVAAGVSLALILVHIIVFLHGRLRVTLLGELVSLHVRGYHILMTLSALVMGGLATLETLLLSVTERAAELGLLKAVGWKSRHIFTTVMLEGVLIAAQGGAAGAAVALLLIWLLSGNVMPQAWWMAGLGLAGAAALGALGAAYPAWRAQGLAPARALTGTRDAFQVKVDRLKTRQWLAGVGLAALAVAVFALLGGRKDVVLEPLGTALRPEPTLHPAVQLFSADRMLVDAESIAAFGPRDPASPGAAQAADAIAEAFESAGLQVRRQPVPLPVVDVFPSGGGQPVLTLGIRPVEVSCVALSFPGSGDEEPITGPVLFVRQGSAWPSADEVSGRVLVVEDPAMDLGMFYQDLYRHYGIPAPYEAALCVREREPGAMEVLERQEGLRAQVRMTENVEGFLPGDEAPDREIWLVVHYDTLPRSPGAEASASGTAVLMELARVLSGVGSPISVRFIAMGGSGTGLEGAVTRLQESPVEASNVVGVLVLERLGGWRQLSVAADAALREPSQAAGAEDFLRPYWMQCLDVGRVGAMDWLRREEATSARAAGAPPVLLDSALKAGQSLEIEIERQGDPCGGMYAAFLYRGLPAVELCGLGNDLVSTPYDTIVGLQGNRLLQAVVVAYQMIQSWLGGN